MHAMKTLKLTLLVVIPLAVFALVGGSAKAYFYQPTSYPTYSYNPYKYGYQDNVTQMIQGHLNFVSNFVYVPAPVHTYFFQYLSPYRYYGW